MLDEIDKRIIMELQVDGRSSYQSIARKLELSVPTVFRRVQRLLNDGVISITAIPNPFKVGHPNVAGICIDADLTKVDTICDNLAIFPEVHMVATLYGRFDILCWVHTSSSEELNAFIRKISKIDGIKDIETMIFSQITKRTYGWLSNCENTGPDNR